MRFNKLNFVVMIGAAGLFLTSGIHHVAGQIREPAVVIKAVIPSYPVVAASLNKSGPVNLRISVDREGKVQSVSIIDGDKILGNSAVEATRHWVFSSDEGQDARFLHLRFNFLLIENVGHPRDLWSTFSAPYEVEVRGQPVKVIDNPNVDPKLKRKKRSRNLRAK